MKNLQVQEHKLLLLLWALSASSCVLSCNLDTFMYIVSGLLTLGVMSWLCPTNACIVHMIEKALLQILQLHLGLEIRDSVPLCALTVSCLKLAELIGLLFSVRQPNSYLCMWYHSYYLFHILYSIKVEAPRACYSTWLSLESLAQAGAQGRNPQMQDRPITIIKIHYT